jgi:4-hydroxy-tetrahydrodipicolinate reductase
METAVPTPIRVVLYGFGRVNGTTYRLAVTRPWLRVDGLIASRERAPDPSGGIPLPVTADAEGLLERVRPDVVIMATRSRLADVMPQLRIALAARPRAILCTAEELAWVEPGPVRDELEMLAADAGTALVATGVNPGFVLDLWPLVASGLAWDITSIHAHRISDVSAFAPATRMRLGLDHTPGSFAAGVTDGSVVGHLGFPESLRILAARMGRSIDRIRMRTDPVMADRRYELPDGVIEAGRTIGASQRAEAWIDGAPWITVELMVHGAPRDAGVPPIDDIRIEGTHPIHVRVDPGAPGVRGTAALLVNGIPRALAAPAGLYAPGDLPPVAPWLGDARPGRKPFQ